MNHEWQPHNEWRDGKLHNVKCKNCGQIAVRLSNNTWPRHPGFAYKVEGVYDCAYAITRHVMES